MPELSYRCPLPTCEWRLVDPPWAKFPAEIPTVPTGIPGLSVRPFEDGVLEHLQTHDVYEWANALRSSQEASEKRLQAVHETVTLWRDRPGGDVGLAIALSGILDTTQPEPPASAALVRVLRECDRIERAVRDMPQDPDFDGAYLAAIKHIREAIGPTP